MRSDLGAWLKLRGRPETGGFLWENDMTWFGLGGSPEALVGE